LSLQHLQTTPEGVFFAFSINAKIQNFEGFSTNFSRKNLFIFLPVSAKKSIVVSFFNISLPIEINEDNPWEVNSLL